MSDSPCKHCGLGEDEHHLFEPIPKKTIDLVCTKCKKRVPTPRAPYDYPEAVEMHLKCPDCWDGDFDEPSYFDANGKPVEYDPDLIRTPGSEPRR